MARLIACPICGKLVKGERGLKIHLRKAHGITEFVKETTKTKVEPALVVKKDGGRIIEIHVNLDKDKPLEKIRVYLKGSGKTSKPARVWGLNVK